MADQISRETTWEIDHCDDCGREMPFTGDSFCLVCTERDEERRTCIVCRGPKIFLDEETCSAKCQETYDGWPEP